MRIDLDLNPLEWAARARALVSTVTMADVLDHAAAARGGRDAVCLERPLGVAGFERRVWTYVDLHRFVATAASALAALGVTRGSTVAVCTGNALDMPLLILAALRLGAVAVPLNHQLRAEELRFITQDCGAETLIVDRFAAAEALALARTASDGSPLRRIIWAPVDPPSPDEIAPDVGVPCYELAASMLHARPARPAELDPEATAAIFYTSGTTGFPKGAMLSSSSLLSRFAWLLALPMNPGRALVHALPTAHVMGFVAFLGALLGGAVIHYLPRFDAHRVLDLLEAEEIDGFLGVPSMYQLLHEADAASRDLRNVRIFASAADVMPGSLIDTFKNMGRLFGRSGPSIPAAFVEVYGSVELSGAAMVRLSLPWVPPAQGGFVGLPLPGYRTRIVGPDGAELPSGYTGELLIQGPGVFKGYHGRHDATQEATGHADARGPWLRTGDLASRTRLGFVEFVGREKDVIKTGGYSIFPAEIEAQLLLHPDVAKAAVVGLPHPTKGAMPVAFICLREGATTDAQRLHNWIGERVAPYKTPRRVLIIPHDEMPYGATGKIAKRLLQERYRELLTTSAAPTASRSDAP